MKYCLIFLLILISLFLGACSNSSNVQTPKNELDGLATPIQLNNGITSIPLSNYFTTKIEALNIICDSLISANISEDILTINVGEKLNKALYNLRIETSENSYDLLLRSPQKVRITLVLKNKSYKNVRVKSSFNDWKLDDMILNHGGQWTAVSEAFPGKYEYVFVVDGKEITDPENPLVVSNNLGGLYSVLDLSIEDSESFPMISQLLENNKGLSFKIENSDDVFIYWENFRLDHTIAGDEVAFLIPSFCETVKQSHLRIYACNDNFVSNDVLIPLEYGKIIRSSD